MDFLAHALLVENDLAVLAVVEAGGGVGDDLDEQRFHGGSFGKIGRGSEILALLQTQSQGICGPQMSGDFEGTESPRNPPTLYWTRGCIISSPWQWPLCSSY